jgi:hypothetical protein
MSTSSDRPDPTRLRLLRSVFEPSPLATVADAVSVATEHETLIYVERLSDGWRWSLAHLGGSYPLLRITARFLRVEHHNIMIGFRTVLDGVAILCDDPEHVVLAEAAGVITFEPNSTPGTVERRIVDALGTTLSGPLDTSEDPPV